MSYTLEQKEEAIRFYLNNSNSVKLTCETLGYPSTTTLIGWLKDALGSSTPLKKRPRYTPEQKMFAIKYYLENGNNASRTIRDIGYPSLVLLRKWLSEDVPSTVMKAVEKSRKVVRYTEEQKKYAVEYYINHDRNLSYTVQALGYPSAPALSKWVSRYSPAPKAKLVRKVNSSNVLSNLDANAVQDNMEPQSDFRDKQEQSENVSIIQRNAVSKTVFPEDVWMSKLYGSKQKEQVEKTKFTDECYDELVTILDFSTSENTWKWKRIGDVMAELAELNVAKCSYLLSLSKIAIGKVLVKIADNYTRVKRRRSRCGSYYLLPPLKEKAFIEEVLDNKSSNKKLSPDEEKASTSTTNASQNETVNTSQSLKAENLRYVKHIRKMKQQIRSLNEELYRVRMEKDALEMASKIIKKDLGISLDGLSNHEKAIVIDALKSKYGLKNLLQLLNIAKSSYFYQEKAMMKPDKYGNLRDKIKSIFYSNYKCYGYRRVHKVLARAGIVVSEKIVRRLMKEEQLIVHVPKKKYRSYQGEITPAVENIVNRDFRAGKPNEKWLTDITEFSLPSSNKIYLSSIIDCFDGGPVAWAIHTSPNEDLANETLRRAIKTLRPGEHPIVHSDRGCHYRWPGWIDIMNSAELIRSMSKKGCSPDNSPCEGHFGHIKNEMFYNRDWKNVTTEEFIAYLDNYMIWFAEKRIKMSLGGMSPVEYRKKLGL